MRRVRSASRRAQFGAIGAIGVSECEPASRPCNTRQRARLGATRRWYGSGTLSRVAGQFVWRSNSTATPRTIV